MTRPPLTYADFVPGAEIASCEMQVPEDAGALLSDAFPDLDLAGGEGGIELTLAMLMRAYTTLVAPRPPGNVHAGQKMAMPRLLQPGDHLSARAVCLAKEEKRGRLWVTFGLRLHSGDEDFVTAEMRLAWAA